MNSRRVVQRGDEEDIAHIRPSRRAIGTPRILPRNLRREYEQLQGLVGELRRHAEHYDRTIAPENTVDELEIMRTVLGEIARAAEGTRIADDVQAILRFAETAEGQSRNRAASILDQAWERVSALRDVVDAELQFTAIGMPPGMDEQTRNAILNGLESLIQDAGTQNQARFNAGIAAMGLYLEFYPEFITQHLSVTTPGSEQFGGVSQMDEVFDFVTGLGELAGERYDDRMMGLDRAWLSRTRTTMQQERVRVRRTQIADLREQITDLEQRMSQEGLEDEALERLRRNQQASRRLLGRLRDTGLTISAEDVRAVTAEYQQLTGRTQPRTREQWEQDLRTRGQRLADSRNHVISSWGDGVLDALSRNDVRAAHLCALLGELHNVVGEGSIRLSQQTYDGLRTLVQRAEQTPLSQLDYERAARLLTTAIRLGQIDRITREYPSLAPRRREGRARTELRGRRNRYNRAIDLVEQRYEQAFQESNPETRASLLEGAERLSEMALGYVRALTALPRDQRTAFAETPELVQAFEEEFAGRDGSEFFEAGLNSFEMNRGCDELLRQIEHWGARGTRAQRNAMAGERRFLRRFITETRNRAREDMESAQAMLSAARLYVSTAYALGETTTITERVQQGEETIEVEGLRVVAFGEWEHGNMRAAMNAMLNGQEEVEITIGERTETLPTEVAFMESWQLSHTHALLGYARELRTRSVSPQRAQERRVLGLVAGEIEERARTGTMADIREATVLATMAREYLNEDRYSQMWSGRDSGYVNGRTSMLLAMQRQVNSRTPRARAQARALFNNARARVDNTHRGLQAYSTVDQRVREQGLEDDAELTRLRTRAQRAAADGNLSLYNSLLDPIRERGVAIALERNEGEIRTETLRMLRVIGGEEEARMVTVEPAHAHVIEQRYRIDEDGRRVEITLPEGTPVVHDPRTAVPEAISLDETINVWRRSGEGFLPAPVMREREQLEQRRVELVRQIQSGNIPVQDWTARYNTFIQDLSNFQARARAYSVVRRERELNTQYLDAIRMSPSAYGGLSLQRAEQALLEANRHLRDAEQLIINGQIPDDMRNYGPPRRTQEDVQRDVNAFRRRPVSAYAAAMDMRRQAMHHWRGYRAQEAGADLQFYVDRRTQYFEYIMGMRDGELEEYEPGERRCALLERSILAVPARTARRAFDLPTYLAERPFGGAGGSARSIGHRQMRMHQLASGNGSIEEMERLAQQMISRDRYSRITESVAVFAIGVALTPINPTLGAAVFLSFGSARQMVTELTVDGYVHTETAVAAAAIVASIGIGGLMSTYSQGMRFSQLLRDPLFWTGMAIGVGFGAHSIYGGVQALRRGMTPEGVTGILTGLFIMGHMTYNVSRGALSDPRTLDWLRSLRTDEAMVGGGPRRGGAGGGGRLLASEDEVVALTDSAELGAVADTVGSARPGQPATAEQVVAAQVSTAVPEPILSPLVANARSRAMDLSTPTGLRNFLVDLLTTPVAERPARLSELPRDVREQVEALLADEAVTGIVTANPFARDASMLPREVTDAAGRIRDSLYANERAAVDEAARSFEETVPVELLAGEQGRGGGAPEQPQLQLHVDGTVAVVGGGRSRAPSRGGRVRPEPMRATERDGEGAEPLADVPGGPPSREETLGLADGGQPSRIRRGMAWTGERLLNWGGARPRARDNSARDQETGTPEQQVSEIDRAFQNAATEFDGIITNENTRGQAVDAFETVYLEWRYLCQRGARPEQTAPLERVMERLYLDRNVRAAVRERAQNGEPNSEGIVELFEGRSGEGGGLLRSNRTLRDLTGDSLEIALNRMEEQQLRAERPQTPGQPRIEPTTLLPEDMEVLVITAERRAHRRARDRQTESRESADRARAEREGVRGELSTVRRRIALLRLQALNRLQRLFERKQSIEQQETVDAEALEAVNERIVLEQANAGISTRTPLTQERIDQQRTALAEAAGIRVDQSRPGRLRPLLDRLAFVRNRQSRNLRTLTDRERELADRETQLNEQIQGYDDLIAQAYVPLRETNDIFGDALGQADQAALRVRLNLERVGDEPLVPNQDIVVRSGPEAELAGARDQAMSDLDSYLGEITLVEEGRGPALSRDVRTALGERVSSEIRDGATVDEALAAALRDPRVREGLGEETISRLERAIDGEGRLSERIARQAERPGADGEPVEQRVVDELGELGRFCDIIAGSPEQGSPTQVRQAVDAVDAQTIVADRADQLLAAAEDAPLGDASLHRARTPFIPPESRLRDIGRWVLDHTGLGFGRGGRTRFRDVLLLREFIARYYQRRGGRRSRLEAQMVERARRLQPHQRRPYQRRLVEREPTERRQMGWLPISPRAAFGGNPFGEGTAASYLTAPTTLALALGGMLAYTIISIIGDRAEREERGRTELRRVCSTIQAECAAAGVQLSADDARWLVSDEGRDFLRHLVQRMPVVPAEAEQLVRPQTLDQLEVSMDEEWRGAIVPDRYHHVVQDSREVLEYLDDINGYLEAMRRGGAGSGRARAALIALFDDRLDIDYEGYRTWVAGRREQNPDLDNDLGPMTVGELLSLRWDHWEEQGWVADLSELRAEALVVDSGLDLSQPRTQALIDTLADSEHTEVYEFFWRARAEGHIPLTYMGDALLILTQESGEMDENRVTELEQILELTDPAEQTRRLDDMFGNSYLETPITVGSILHRMDRQTAELVLDNRGSASAIRLREQFDEVMTTYQDQERARIRLNGFAHVQGEEEFTVIYGDITTLADYVMQHFDINGDENPIELLRLRRPIIEHLVEEGYLLRSRSVGDNRVELYDIDPRFQQNRALAQYVYRHSSENLETGLIAWMHDNRRAIQGNEYPLIRHIQTRGLLHRQTTETQDVHARGVVRTMSGLIEEDGDERVRRHLREVPEEEPATPTRRQEEEQGARVPDITEPVVFNRSTALLGVSDTPEVRRTGTYAPSATMERYLDYSVMGIPLIPGQTREQVAADFRDEFYREVFANARVAARDGRSETARNLREDGIYPIPNPAYAPPTAGETAEEVPGHPEANERYLIGALWMITQENADAGSAGPEIAGMLGMDEARLTELLTLRANRTQRSEYEEQTTPELRAALDVVATMLERRRESNSRDMNRMQRAFRCRRLRGIARTQTPESLSIVDPFIPLFLRRQGIPDERAQQIISLILQNQDDEDWLQRVGLQRIEHMDSEDENYVIMVRGDQNISLSASDRTTYNRNRGTFRLMATVGLEEVLGQAERMMEDDMELPEEQRTQLNDMLAIELQVNSVDADWVESHGLRREAQGTGRNATYVLQAAPEFSQQFVIPISRPVLDEIQEVINSRVTDENQRIELMNEVIFSIWTNCGEQENASGVRTWLSGSGLRREDEQGIVVDNEEYLSDWINDMLDNRQIPAAEESVEE